MDTTTTSIKERTGINARSQVDKQLSVLFAPKCCTTAALETTSLCKEVAISPGLGANLINLPSFYVFQLGSTHLYVLL